MDLLELIEERLRARVAARMKAGKARTATEPEELDVERKEFAGALFKLFEAFSGPEVEKDEEPIKVTERLEPTPEIIERARKLQALALRTDSDSERENAWAGFQKLWNRYRLPNNLM